MSQNAKQPARGTQPDYYRILGVDGNASPEEIAEAYRALVLQCHPDLNPGDPQAEARFLAVQAAFEVLGNRVRRTAYDRTRGPYRTFVPSKIDPDTWHVQLYPLKAKQPLLPLLQIEKLGGRLLSVSGGVGVDLSGTLITDVGLEILKGLEQLKELDLGGTKVTDRGLENLKGLNQLQRLWLNDTKVTDEGVKKLKQTLPRCEIAH